jgi:hypothetical protein
VRALPFLAALFVTSPALAAEVPHDATRITEDSLGKLLRDAHRQLFGVTPGPERLLGAWAHVELETARGSQCFAHNLGNLTVTSDWDGDFSVLRVLERVPKHPTKWKEQPIRFRAYGSAMEGALDYWRVLSGRFGSAMARMDDGDALGAGNRLCEAGYSTADCDGYSRGLDGLYRGLRVSWLHRIGDLDATGSEEITLREWDEIARVNGVDACVVSTLEPQASTGATTP